MRDINEAIEKNINFEMQVLELRKNEYTVTEISSILHVSSEKVSNAIKSLTEKGLLATKYKNLHGKSMLKRKQRALELLEDGKTVKEIAHELEVSIDTVYKYIKEFIKDDKGNVKQVVIVSLESKQVEGRMQMVPVKGSEKTLDADIVLIAAGFVGCEDYVAKAFDVKLTPRGNVADENYQTNQKQLYVAGDMRRGQSLVVWAIREGRDCAKEVDQALMGYSNL